MSEYFGPLYGWTVIAAARSPRIWAAGALLKNSLVMSRTAGSSRASTWLGKAPIAWKAFTCCSGAVIQLANSLAWSGWSDCVGTTRNEPPQLPPPPGNAFAKSHPSTPSAFPDTTPSIQPGQAIVAKPSFWKDAVQSSLHWVSFVDRPAETLSVSVA